MATTMDHQSHPIPIEPWTVYGDAVSPQDVGPTVVEVPDIGVLPPPGRYLGTVAFEACRPVPAHLTVNARAYGCPAGVARRIKLEFGPSALVGVGPRVAVVFEAVDLESPPSPEGACRGRRRT